MNGNVAIKKDWNFGLYKTVSDILRLMISGVNSRDEFVIFEVSTNHDGVKMPAQLMHKRSVNIAVKFGNYRKLELLGGVVCIHTSFAGQNFEILFPLEAILKFTDIKREIIVDAVVAE